MQKKRKVFFSRATYGSFGLDIVCFDLTAVF